MVSYYFNFSDYSAYEDDDFVQPSRSSLTHDYEFGPLGPWTMYNFDTHQIICIWIMKVMGTLSMLASYLIVRDIVIRYYRRERIRLTSKMIFELSIGDFFGSFFSAFMGTWMVPRESGAYMATGTMGSCTAQGFLTALFYGIAITMNAVLAITYYQLVKNEREDATRTKRSTRLILGLPPLIPLVLSSLPLINHGYNYTDMSTCGVGEFPLGCLVLDEVFPYGCTQGTSALAMKYIQLSFILLINLIIVVSVLLMISHAISKDRKMNRSTSTNLARTNSNSLNGDVAIDHVGKNDNNNKTTKFLWQGVWYVASFQISWFPWYVWQWLRITDDGIVRPRPYESASLLYILSITHPSQGFLNSLVFFRPSYLKYRHRDEKEFRLASICRVLNIPVPKVLLVEWWESFTKKWSESEDVVGEGNGDAKRDDPQDVGDD